MSVTSVPSLPRAQAVPGIEDYAPALPFRSRSWIPLALMAADLLVLEACLGLALLLRHALVPWLPISLGPENFLGVAAGLMVLPVAFGLLGLYPGYGISGPERLRRRVVATTAVFATLIGWDYLVQDGQWSRGILLTTWLLATITLPVTTASLIGLLIRARSWGTPVLVMGPPDAARFAVNNLKTVPRTGLVPIGYVAAHGAAEAGDMGVPCVGTVREINDFAPRVKTVMIMRPKVYGERLPQIVAGLAFPHIILVPDFASMQSLWVTTRDLGESSGLEIKKNLLIPHNRTLKRAFDLAITVPLFAFSLPLLGFLCLAIMAASPGSPFFAQLREGEGGRRLRMLKLRTMHLDAEARLKAHLESDAEARREWANHYKLRRDPRILPVIGNFLRKSSLDELPQLWHILKGEMSLVGPRPFPHYHLEGFGADFRALRRSVKPGLTGLWQVEARSDGNLAVQERHDTFYIRNWSPWLDLHILMRTFVAVLSGNGAR